VSPLSPLGIENLEILISRIENLFLVVASKRRRFSFLERCSVLWKRKKK
jgi:hypothetical protein